MMGSVADSEGTAEPFGEDFIARCFTSPTDLTEALSRSISMLVHTRSIMRLLGPDIKARTLLDATRNPFDAAQRIVLLLVGSNRTDLQQAVLEFVERHPSLSHCLLWRPARPPSSEEAAPPYPPPDATDPASIEIRVQAHHDEAIRLRDQGELAAAVRFFEEVASFRRILGEPPKALRARALMQQVQGRLAYAQDDFAEAETFFQQSRYTLAALDPDDLDASISRIYEMLCKARLAFSLGSFERTKILCSDAMQLWESLRLATGSDFSRSIEYEETRVNLYETNSTALEAFGENDEAKTSAAFCSRYSGLLSYRRRDYFGSVPLLERAQHLFDQLGDAHQATICQAETLRSQAHAAFDFGEYRDSIRLRTQERVLWEKVGEAQIARESEACINEAEGEIHFSQSEWAAARQSWEEANQIWEEEGLPDQARYSQNRIKETERHIPNAGTKKA